MVEVLGDGDFVCIAVYFFLVLAVGLWSTFKPTKDSATGYFLAGKTMTWIPVGASIYASNVGAPMFIGLAGTAAAGGIACAIYEWHAAYLLLAAGWVFVPVYIASGAFTMPEYLKKRFGGVRLRVYMSVLALVLYILTKISAEIFSGAIFMEQLLGWNLYACVGVILLVTAAYTVTGGLIAVIYTDTLQTGVLIIGASILFVISLIDVGGWNDFWTRYGQSAANVTLNDPVNYSCGLPRSDFMHIWRDPVTADLPWPGTVFGLTTLGIWVWCTDQIMVQRCLSAKNMSHSKAGTVLAGFLKLTSFLLFIIPGMISRVFYPDEVACADPVSCKKICGNAAGCSNIAYPLLVLRRMPEGLRGIMLAALLAALMSSLTSIFNSASSMFTMDIWRRFRRRAPQHELMIVGRVCVVVMFGVSIMWLPIVEQAQGGQMWIYLQTVSACLSPPWCCLYLLAVFWKGTTEAGAFWGVILSNAVGIARMVLEFLYPAPKCGSPEEDKRPSVLKDVHFLYFAMILSGVSLVSTVAISLLTTRRPPEKLHKVTWWTRKDKMDPEETESEDDFGVEEAQEEEPKTPTPPPSRSKRYARAFINWLCGMSDTPKPKLTKEEKLVIRKRMTDISESPSARRLTTVGAIAVALVTTFLLGFFR